MFKASLSVFLLFQFVLLCAQDGETLKGQFTGENLDKSFINVINMSQATATISQSDGKFKIKAQTGDSILISSIQYKKIKFVVKPEFFTDSLKIPLILKVNELDQVNLYSLGLTGNLETDAQNIRTKKTAKMDFGSFDISKAYDEDVQTQAEFTHRNVAMEQNPIPASVDFKAVFRLLNGLFTKQKKNENSLDEKNYNTSRLNDLSFFVDVLEIKEEDIDNFLTYARSKGMNNTMLKSSNELDLIEFLMKISKEFKAENEK